MQFTEFKIDNLEQFPKDLEKLLAKQLETINEITNSDKISYKEVLKPMQDLDNELELFFTPLSHLNSVNNSEESKKAYEESLPQLSKFSSQIAQNEKLFEKIKSITSNDLEEKKVINNNIRDFILSGAQLPIEQKKELEKLDNEIVPMSLKSYKPMEIEDALNELKSDDGVFKVFYDMDDNFRVLYKMKDGVHYGLY